MFGESKLMEKCLHIHRRPKGGECMVYDLNKLERCIMFNGNCGTHMSTEWPDMGVSHLLHMY
jgi:hypothetical protein